jgi:hypothetical protein
LMIALHFAASFLIRAAKLSGPGTPALAPCLRASTVAPLSPATS